MSVWIGRSLNLSEPQILTARWTVMSVTEWHGDPQGGARQCPAQRPAPGTAGSMAATMEQMTVTWQRRTGCPVPSSWQGPAEPGSVCPVLPWSPAEAKEPRLEGTGHLKCLPGSHLPCPSAKARHRWRGERTAWPAGGPARRHGQEVAWPPGSRRQTQPGLCREQCGWT